MNILALDTATAVLSVALASPDGVRCFSTDAGLRHSEVLMDMVAAIMKSAGLKSEDLELVSCMKGPGSFTGLRIGFATAKGIALARGIPLVSVPTLDCMAAPFSFRTGLVIPVMDAKKHCYYTALYRGGKRISDYMDTDARSIADMAAANGGDEKALLTGPDSPLLQEELSGLSLLEGFSTAPFPKRGWGLELLELSRGYGPNPGDPLAAGPLYIRKSDAELTHDSGQKQ
jgi:tRNA threonylcarbamoyladenosine biosynthesis protein TsaB